MAQSDYYELLGVTRGASEQEIKRSFRRLARELHPDVNRHDPSAEEQFKEIAEAYEVLSDADKRATYDRYGHDGLRSGGYRPTDDPMSSFADIFGAIFGGFAGGGETRGGDIEVAARIELVDVLHGVKVDVKYEAISVCEHCHGNQAEPGTPILECERCDGAGQLRAVTRTPFGQVARAVVCDVCGGSGRVPRDPCKVCSGRGRTVSEQELAVDVPAGIADGQRIRLAGRGHAGEGGGTVGDLYVEIAVARHEDFVREGNDLVSVVDISAPDAALGTTLIVPSLEGELELEIAAGTQPGEVLDIAGAGLPPLRGGKRGAQRNVVNVVIPRNLTADQREMLDAFRETLGEHNLESSEGMLSKLRRVIGR